MLQSVRAYAGERESQRLSSGTAKRKIEEQLQKVNIML